MDQKSVSTFRRVQNDSETSLDDRLAVAGRIAATLPMLVYWSVAYPFKRYRQLPFKDQMFANLEGFFTKSLNIHQLRTLVPVEPARKALGGYIRCAKRLGLSDFNAYFGGETYTAHWIHQVPDRQSSDPVIIYLHGGGYALSIAAPQISYILKFAAKYASKRVSVLMLDYTVTPSARYPDQLAELVGLYNDLEKSSTNIHILGDSCGCHLAIQLCTHSAEPVDGIDPVNSTLKSLIFFSPWCGLDVSVGGSYDLYGDKDILDKATSREMQKMFCSSRALSDPRVNPVLETRTEFWDKVLPRKVVVVYGEYEILGDGIKQWCKSAGVEPFMERAGVHDAMLLGFKGPSTKHVCSTLDKWLSS